MAVMSLFRHRFYKNDGSLNAGGLVYSYVAGTSTPTPTYTTASATVQNSNPIVLDAKGEADIWTSGTVKINVLESDNTQVTGYPVDNLGTSTLISPMVYQGTWNATANSPALSSSSGTRGYTYIVSVAGSTALNGISTWLVDDLLSFNGSVWERIVGGNSTATASAASAAAALVSEGNAATSAGTATTQAANASGSAAAAAASAASVNLPTPAVALNFLRANAGASGYELQTPAQVLSDIGGAGTTQIQTQAYTTFTTGGTSTAFTLTPTPALAALSTGHRFNVTFDATAGVTPTLAISMLTAKPIKLYNAAGAKVAASPTTIISGMVTDIEYDGTDYVILNPLPPQTSSGGLLAELNFTAQTQALTSISNGTPAVFTCTSALHLPENGSPIQLTTSGALPTGLSIATTYFVSGASGTTYNVSDTQAHALAGTNKVATSSAGSGTHTMNSIYVKNANASYIVVEGWGAGGGGGGVTAVTCTGGGGGAGGYFRQTLLAANIVATETITIGAGGTAGANTGGTGGTGGTTSFGAHASATGGVGGVGASSGVNTLGGLGGVGSGGDINLTGNPGGGGVANGYGAIGSVGGVSSLGGAGRGVVTTNPGNNSANNSGSGATGGWGGASAQIGGIGGSGRVLVREYS